jgi:hypothetical protein
LITFHNGRWPCFQLAFLALFSVGVNSQAPRLEEKPSGRQDHRPVGDWPVCPGGSGLMFLRGISVLTAFGLAVEIGDWSRFTGSSIDAYLWLVPSETLLGRIPDPGRDR